MPGERALEQERPPGAVVAEQPHGAVAIPESQGVRLLRRLVVLWGDELEDGFARGRDERVARECEGLAELEPPLQRDAVVAQLRRSTIIAMPWPPPTHIVSRPIVPSSVSRSFRSVHMIRAPVMP